MSKYKIILIDGEPFEYRWDIDDTTTLPRFVCDTNIHTEETVNGVAATVFTQVTKFLDVVNDGNTLRIYRNYENAIGQKINSFNALKTAYVGGGDVYYTIANNPVFLVGEIVGVM